MVLAFAMVEGSANDWLALALIDGYDARQWVGVAGFSLFVTAMTRGGWSARSRSTAAAARRCSGRPRPSPPSGVLLVVLGGLAGARRPGDRALGPGRRARVPGRA